MRDDAKQGARLGLCCVCERADDGVRNVLMLPQRSPMPDRGWGCFQCGASGGAVAVVHDACLDQPLRFACRGFPCEDGRIRIDELGEGGVEHDLRRHPEIVEAGT